MSLAACDQNSFYPFRSLVQGPLTALSNLAAAERFVRTVVLHDNIEMELEPWGDSGIDEWTEEEKAAGVKNVITAIGPDTRAYDFFAHGLVTPDPSVELTPRMIALARTFSHASEGDRENPYFKAHVEYLQRVLGTVAAGGSALLAGAFGRAVEAASSQFPDVLFQQLDREWQVFAREADTGRLGLVVPPVLSIVLSRATRRDAIPQILKDLRDEWGVARARVWALVQRLKSARTIQEAIEIRRELEAASRLFVPTNDNLQTRPVRVLWDIITGTTATAATAAILGGDPTIGALVGAVGTAVRSGIPAARELGKALFGRGAFDLAKRVRQEALLVEPGALNRLLSDSEKKRLGL